MLPEWVTQPVSVELPAAPEPFASWIEQGNVSLDFYDPQREVFAFAAETRFHYHYSYRCRTRWRLLDEPDLDHKGIGKTAPADSLAEPEEPALLEVRLVYDEVKLSIAHRIRLPERIAGPDFFASALVRHEFDHIAISADPKLQDRLKRMLMQRNAVILEPLDENAFEKSRRSADTQQRVAPAAAPAHAADEDEQLQRHYAAVARAAARRQTELVFDDFIAGIAIRYRELDRLTSHGRHPLPPEQRTRLIDSASP